MFVLCCSKIGLCSEPGRVQSNIILAGDPKQMDAVTKSLNAVKLGFKISFMEYLSEQKLYSRNGGIYNSNHIVKLTKNYRSHQAILKMPNKLFYDGVLEAKASPGKSKTLFTSIQSSCFILHEKSLKTLLIPETKTEISKKISSISD